MSFFRCLAPIVVVLCLSLFTGSEGVRIKNLSVPGAVASNSNTPIILDCDYDLEEGLDNEGLVVKWYFNDYPNPIYQWIVGRKPTALGVFKKSVTKDFKINEDPMKMYRAVKIETPSKELSGTYRCDVSSSDNEATEAKMMIIYTPAKSLELNHNVEGELLTLDCLGTGVFPEPNITITTNERLKNLPNLPIEIERMSKEGSYDIEAKLKLDVKDLPEQITFNCILNIPDTNYTLQKSTSVYPRPSPKTSTVSPRDLRATARSTYEEDAVPNHYDPDLFFIHEDGSSGSWRTLAGLFTILMSLVTISL
ncbi:uncharacterized protein [Halyomorpha halys]|uniref:uncharacterized protein n=1 Tax=Halyomorpha halys TaxID=286706 RepID=UPI0006D4D309